MEKLVSNIHSIVHIHQPQSSIGVKLNSLLVNSKEKDNKMSIVPKAKCLTSSTFAGFLVILSLQLWPQSSATWLAVLPLFSAMCLAGLLHLHCFSRVHLCPSFTGHVIVPLHYVTSPHSFASSSVFCFVAVYCFFIFVPVVLHLLLYLVPSSFLFPRFFTFSLLPSSTQGVIMWLFTLVERLHSCFVLLSCISFFFRLFGV